MERTAGKELALVRGGWGSSRGPHVPSVPQIQKLQASAPRFPTFLQNGCALESPFGDSEFLTS